MHCGFVYLRSGYFCRNVLVPYIGKLSEPSCVFQCAVNGGMYVGVVRVVEDHSVKVIRTSFKHVGDVRIGKGAVLQSWKCW